MSEFYGYINEENLRENIKNEIANEIVNTSTFTMIRVCTRKASKCIGSIGDIFYYADGSTDSGQLMKNYRSLFKGDVYSWGE